MFISFNILYKYKWNTFKKSILLYACIFLMINNFERFIKIFNLHFVIILLIILNILFIQSMPKAYKKHQRNLLKVYIKMKTKLHIKVKIIDVKKKK